MSSSTSGSPDYSLIVVGDRCEYEGFASRITADFTEGGPINLANLGVFLNAKTLEDFRDQLNDGQATKFLIDADVAWSMSAVEEIIKRDQYSCYLPEIYLIGDKVKVSLLSIMLMEVPDLHDESDHQRSDDFYEDDED